jgi:nucleoside-diphosphate-sugar epimerase
MKKVVVTGSAGFIGGHLTDALLRLGIRVLGVDNLKTGLQSTMESHLLCPNFIPKYYDIRSVEAYNAIVEFSPDIVFHLAAIPGVTDSVVDPVFTSDVNIGGTVNILTAAKDSLAKRLVFSSSSSVYGGAGAGPLDEDSALVPKSPYALQKKVCEEYCRLFSNIYSLDTISLRYFNVFGPRQRSDSPYAAAISSFCNNAAREESPKIYGDGKQTRDFCFVENVVSANLLSAEHEGLFGGEPFNIGCGESVSISSVCKDLDTLEPIYMEERSGDIKHSNANITKAKNVLGYNPRVSYKEGLGRTLDWHINNQR